ncbi:hypothetical protein KIN20_006219 [Parelaphostrongylus tenuis]|uniref:Uncharacterized protein n=1 Tax=Parelaphostrongylus tenuis TaxID=148309 RepID=A0AAD5MM95_PARTN|nr:hypothetical protein KIN20_006219 [Parelaphostrongylus tenuis]
MSPQCMTLWKIFHRSGCSLFRRTSVLTLLLPHRTYRIKSEGYEKIFAAQRDGIMVLFSVMNIRPRVHISHSLRSAEYCYWDRAECAEAV